MVERWYDLSDEAFLKVLEEIMEFRKTGELPKPSLFASMCKDGNRNIREEEDIVLDVAADRYETVVLLLMQTRQNIFLKN